MLPYVNTAYEMDKIKYLYLSAIQWLNVIASESSGMKL